MKRENASSSVTKVSVILCVFVLSSPLAHAAWSLSVNGSTSHGGEITIQPGDTVTIDIEDSVGANKVVYLDFYYESEALFSLSNWGPGPITPCFYDGPYSGAIYGIDAIEFEIITNWLPGSAVPGTVFEVDLKCEGEGDVIVKLVDSNTFQVIGTVVIHQVEPPPLYGPQISINGVAINGVSEITVDTGTTISIGIHDDLGNAPPDDFIAYLDFDPNDPLLYTLSNPQLGAAAGDAAAFTGPDPTATANQYQIDQAWSAATPSIGSIFTVDYKVETEGDTVINLWDSRAGLAAPVDTMTIHHDPGCWTGDAASTIEWELAGSPDCWCKSVNPRQCHGDADGRPQGRFDYYTSTDDLDILIAAWNKNLAATLGTGTEGNGLTNGTPWICADFDRQPQGRFLYRVSTDDLDILIARWNISSGPPPDCEDVTGWQ